MIFRRKAKISEHRKYKVDTIGPVVVERVQMPQSIIELDGSHYDVTTWTMYLRVQNGRILAERHYICGEPEAVARHREHTARDYIEVTYDEGAKLHFYDHLNILFDRATR